MKGMISMRFIHIADLHIGKKLNGISLIEDQKYALKQVLRVVEEREIDGIILAGDIYQQTQPSSEAMVVFDAFLSELVNLNMPVYMISGNHDSDERISYLAHLIKQSHVHTTTTFTGVTQIIEVSDEYGKINIHLLPFIKPIDVRRIYPKEEISSYQEAMQVVLKYSKINKEERNILICHQFITGGTTSDSEVFAIGTLDNIDHSVFDDFDYVALGHLHNPQNIGRKEVRYSGSLLKYSLSEISNKKSITIVDVKDKGDIEIETIPLIPLHDVREIKGYFKDLMELPYSEDYVSICLLDDLVIPDAYLTLMTNFPNMIQLKIERNNQIIEQMDFDLENVEDKSVVDLFVDFYKVQNNNNEPNEKQLKIIEDILSDLKEVEE